MGDMLSLYSFQADLIGTLRTQPITITQNFSSYPFIPPTTISGMLENVRRSLQCTSIKPTYMWMEGRGKNRIVEPTQLKVDGVHPHFGVFSDKLHTRRSTKRTIRIGEKREETLFGVLPFEGYMTDAVIFYVVSEKRCEFLEKIKGAMLFVGDSCLIYINNVSMTSCKIEESEYFPLTPVPIEHIEQRLKSREGTVSAKVYLVPLKYLIDGDVLTGVERKLFAQVVEGRAEGRNIKINGKGLPLWW